MPIYLRMKKIKFLSLCFCILLLIPFTFVFGQQDTPSKEQASNIVYDLFGGIIGEIQVFIFEGQTYIAAIRQPYRYSREDEIILLRSFGGGYIKVADIDTRDLSCGVFEELLLGDFNGDDFIDVYWQYQCGGNTLNTVFFNIYDSSTNQIYYSGLLNGYQPSADIKIAENLPSSYMPFLEAKVTEHPLFLMPSATDEPRKLSWRALYGAFTGQKMVAITLQKEFEPLSESSAPLTCYVTASAALDDWQYISCFKDAVYAVNQEQGIYFTVYVPRTSYDWIEELSIYEGLLVIPERNDPSVVTFDPLAFELRRHQQ